MLKPQLLSALGGLDNILKLEAFNTRLSVQLKNPSLANERELLKAGFRGLADLGDGRIQVLAEGDVSRLATQVSEVST
jgi:phosphotransferase system IIB component